MHALTHFYAKLMVLCQEKSPLMYRLRCSGSVVWRCHQLNLWNQKVRELLS